MGGALETAAKGAGGALEKAAKEGLVVMDKAWEASIDGADALAARVPAPAAPRVRAQLARLDDALGDAAYAFPALAF